jgi:hypothetical protein
MQLVQHEGIGQIGARSLVGQSIVKDSNVSERRSHTSPGTLPDRPGFISRVKVSIE